jgi:hypothetical protein
MKSFEARPGSCTWNSGHHPVGALRKINLGPGKKKRRREDQKEKKNHFRLNIRDEFDEVRHELSDTWPSKDSLDFVSDGGTPLESPRPPRSQTCRS